MDEPETVGPDGRLADGTPVPLGPDWRCGRAMCPFWGGVGTYCTCAANR